jgi:DNA-binding transcriptional LysR family regulator
MLDATRLRVLVAIARHGSVTAAAQVLNYAQPSISHHMARLESETGAKLMERSGRGIRLTEAGRLLAGRAEEILGRLDAAEAELAAHVGLKQEKLRLAAFGSALGTLAASAGAALRSDRVKAELSLIQAEPADAVRMLRIGAVDVALIFRYSRDSDHQDVAGPSESQDLSYHLVLDEPVYLITSLSRTGRTAAAGQPAARLHPGRPQAGHPAGQSPVGQSPAGASLLADCAGHRWIAGCERCQDVLIGMCRVAGFSPDIAVTTDDYVAAQALVAAGLGTAILPGLALHALRHPGVAATELAGTRRQVLAVTYGGPPEPPAASALVAALTRSAASYGG